MPHLDHKGPDGQGPKTGRKLGKCRKTDEEKNAAPDMGHGQGKRRHAGGGQGKGKRLNYDKE